MEGKTQTWDNLTAKSSQATKAYSINNSQTAVCHLYAHEFTSESLSRYEAKSYITVATFDRDFVLLESLGFGQNNEVEFKEILKVRTDYPIMHCLIELNFETIQNKYLLIGYLIDIYSTIYTVNLTKATELTQKFSGHPIQFSTITQTFRNEFNLTNQNLLYLETPLFIKKCGANIVSLNLKGQLLIVDPTQSQSWIKSNDLYYQKEFLGAKALAAAHNRTRAKYYQNVIIVATANGRAPYVFVRCASAEDFENQKRGQDKYEWIDDALETTYCAIDPATSLVCVSTVAQTIQIYQIVEATGKGFFYLRKKFGFFVSNHLQYNNINIQSNIECLHAAKHLLIITTSKQHITFDLVDRSIRKRVKGSNFEKLKWGLIIDRKDNYVSILLAKGYNHFNEAQSKLGKPNIHFKTIQLKRDM